jgi:F-type H+-transporting ATPase subunit b
MQINWFTFFAQIINFLVLVWLLKRFLYKPILDAIDEREKKITSQLKDAEEKATEAKREKAEFREKNDLFDQDKRQLMEKVIAETNEERDKLIESARNEAVGFRSKLEKALQEVQGNLKRELVQKTRQEVFAITRMTLNSLASLSLEEQTASVFVKRLKNEKKEFIDAFNASPNPILIRSAFDLPEKQQTEIIRTVQEILGTETQVAFSVKPELISGIELTANGYKLAWNISEFLNSFEKSITEATIEKPTQNQ